jgi:hypothetical protein
MPRTSQSEPAIRLSQSADEKTGHYRQKAEECFAKAMASPDPEAVMVWLDLASGWNDLAGLTQKRRSTTDH